MRRDGGLCCWIRGVVLRRFPFVRVGVAVDSSRRPLVTVPSGFFFFFVVVFSSRGLPVVVLVSASSSLGC